MLGHFVGDYLLQNQWMATEKSYPGWRGHLACTVHVLLYTLAVGVFTANWNPMFLFLVAVPHWIIDRWGLAWKFLSWKNGFDVKKTWEHGPLCAAPAPDKLEQNVWKVAFMAPVYIMNDNTFHFVCLWLLCKFVQG